MLSANRLQEETNIRKKTEETKTENAGKKIVQLKLTSFFFFFPVPT